MKIEITDLSINIDENIDKPSITQADEIMSALTRHEEVKWMVVKIAGMWRITRDGQLVGNSRKFINSLSQATQLTIVSYV